MSKFKVGDIVTLDSYYKEDVISPLVYGKDYLVLAKVGDDHVLLDVPSLAENAIFNDARFVKPNSSSITTNMISMIIDKYWQWMQVTKMGCKKSARLYKKSPYKNYIGNDFQDLICKFGWFNLENFDEGIYRILDGKYFVKMPDRSTFNNVALKYKKGDPIYVKINDRWEKAHFDEYAELGAIRYYGKGKSAWTGRRIDTKIADAGNWKPATEEEKQ